MNIYKKAICQIPNFEIVFSADLDLLCAVFRYKNIFRSYKCGSFVDLYFYFRTISHSIFRENVKFLFPLNCLCKYIV